MESEEEYGFFKDENDIRPSQATWIDKEDCEKLYNLLKAAQPQEYEEK